MPNALLALIEEALAEQGRLHTPVARFAAAHDSNFPPPRSQLIPLSAPAPGEQYAFEVDLDSCSGCKACVSGCHSLNGLDENETWRDVGLVLGGDIAHPFQQTVTTACHHCEDPACLNGCPVLAYEKDAVTGIVRHLDDQCIGCSYCVLKCPYDVPKYNPRLGIVRKCDMCHDRLREGEAPACAQACPTEAIRIVKVSRTTLSPLKNEELKIKNSEPESLSSSSASASTSSASAALSDSSSEISNLKSQITALAAPPSYTRPTTRYVSTKPLPSNLRASDVNTIRPQHAHLALVALLTLTQIGLGLMLSSALAASEIKNHKSLIINGFGFGCFAFGLIASVAHLGQPFRAWRVFLNLRKSWLSREAVVLGTAFPLFAASALLPFAEPYLIQYLPKLPFDLSAAHLPLSLGGLAIGLLGVFCSAMIYADTRRAFWRPTLSFGRMFGTVAVSALTGLALHAQFAEKPWGLGLGAWGLCAALALSAKLALELSTLAGASHPARLQRGPLRSLLVGRLFLGSLALLYFGIETPALAIVFLVMGEFLERTLYFTAVDSPKMPGI